MLSASDPLANDGSNSASVNGSSSSITATNSAAQTANAASSASTTAADQMRTGTGAGMEAECIRLHSCLDQLLCIWKTRAHKACTTTTTTTATKTSFPINRDTIDERLQQQYQRQQSPPRLPQQQQQQQHQSLLQPSLLLSRQERALTGLDPKDLILAAALILKNQQSLANCADLSLSSSSSSSASYNLQCIPFPRPPPLSPGMRNSAFFALQALHFDLVLVRQLGQLSRLLTRVSLRVLYEDRHLLHLVLQVQVGSLQRRAPRLTAACLAPTTPAATQSSEPCFADPSAVTCVNGGRIQMPSRSNRSRHQTALQARQRRPQLRP